MAAFKKPTSEDVIVSNRIVDCFDFNKLIKPNMIPLRGMRGPMSFLIKKHAVSGKVIIRSKHSSIDSDYTDNGHITLFQVSFLSFFRRNMMYIVDGRSGVWSLLKS